MTGLLPPSDQRKMSEVSNLTTQIDSLINSLSKDPESPGNFSLYVMVKIAISFSLV